MELFSGEFLWGLLAVVLIDLVLAGDNAIVIGMAARNVPAEQRKLTIMLGMVGAIIVRVIATAGVVYLLEVPGLLLVGGVLLVWIAYKLLVADGCQHEIEAKDCIVKAVRTIVIADAVMGIDNVLGVAGAAQGSLLLVIIGLAISVPIIIWGSTFFVKCVESFPAIMFIGAGVLAWTAGKMIAGEPMFSEWMIAYPLLKWAIISFTVVGVLGLGHLKNRNASGEPVVADTRAVRVEE